MSEAIDKWRQRATMTMQEQVSRETIVLDDADTGDEILSFWRRGRRYIYLRDRKTRRFIRRLVGIELRFFMVVDYSEEEAKKGNPLYLDAMVIKGIDEELITDIEGQEAEAESLCSGKVAKNFGAYVETQLLDTAGVEYGSELKPNFITKKVTYVRGKLTERDAIKTTIYYWSLVWKHHKEEAPKSLEGWETL